MTEAATEVPYTTAVEALSSIEYPMALMACEEQEVEAASRAKGEETAELFAGSLTLTPPAGDAGAAIFRATSVSQAEPWLPQDFTCSVCAPLGAVTEPFIEFAYTKAVAPESNEYPIAVTGCNEHVTEFATSVKVEEMEASLPGDETETPSTVMATSVSQAEPALPQALTCKRVRARRGGHRGIDRGAVDEGVVAAAIEREAHGAHRLAGACAVSGGKRKLRRNHGAVGGVVDGDLGPRRKRAECNRGAEVKTNFLRKFIPRIPLMGMGLAPGS